MKRKEVLLILALLLSSIGALIAIRGAAFELETATPQVVIYLKDEEYLRIDTEDPQVVLVEQDGRSNKIEITKEGFAMLHSSCDNQYCMYQGEVTFENISQRLFGAWVYCLPNEVSIELVGGE